MTVKIEGDKDTISEEYKHCNYLLIGYNCLEDIRIMYQNGNRFFKVFIPDSSQIKEKIKEFIRSGNDYIVEFP